MCVCEYIFVQKPYCWLALCCDLLIRLEKFRHDLRLPKSSVVIFSFVTTCPAIRNSHNPIILHFVSVNAWIQMLKLKTLRNGQIFVIVSFGKPQTVLKMLCTCIHPYTRPQQIHIAQWSLITLIYIAVFYFWRRRKCSFILWPINPIKPCIWTVTAVLTKMNYSHWINNEA